MGAKELSLGPRPKPQEGNSNLGLKIVIWTNLTKCSLAPWV